MPSKILNIAALCAVWILGPPSFAVEEPSDESTKLFELANGLYLRGPSFYGQAVKQYEEFLRRYPNDERCDMSTMFLGNCLLELKRYQEALQVYLDHQKFKGSQNRDKVNFRTGQAYFLLEKYPEAIPFLLKVYNKKVEPNLAQNCAYWLGWAYLKNNQPQQAIPVLAKLADAERGALKPWADFQLGYAYLAAGDFDKAVERFQGAASALPERKAESLFRMAEAHAKLGNYQKAYAAYKEVVEKHRDSPFVGQAAFGAVWSLYSAKDYQNAIAAYKLCRKLIPQESQAEAAYILGNCYYETNKLAEALQTYRRVAKGFPKTPFAASADYKACWTLFLQDKFDEAIASGTAFVKNHPSYPEIGNIHFLLGESLYERNRINEALSQYLALAERYPKSPFHEKGSFKLGLCYLKAGQLEAARKTFRQLAGAYPGSELAPKALARAAECSLELARNAKAESQQAEYEEVVNDYRVLVEKYPKDVLAGDALYQLGVTYARLKKKSEMMDAFEKLVKTYPKNDNCADAYYWLAAEKEEAGQNDDAADYFERSLNLKPKGTYSEQARYRLAEIYYKKKEHDKAASLVVQMLKDNPQSSIPSETHRWAGDFLLEKGKYAEAIEVYGSFLEKFKTTPLREAVYYGLGDCYFKQQKWQQAIDNFSKAIEFKGDWVSLSRLSSGVAHVKLARYKQAEELLRAVERWGSWEVAAKAIYWLGNMHLGLAEKAASKPEKTEQYNLARTEYIKVVILYDKSELTPECLYRVAECLEQEGLGEEAKKRLRELIDKYPENEFGKKAREKLETAPAGG